MIDVEDGNLGTMPVEVALARAQSKGLDLIEISPNATPPVVKIMDYGKYQYDTQKKERDAKQKAHVTETKTLQVKIGTSDRDLDLKATKASEWLKEGHRIKLDLFLPGRAKYLDPKFLEERLDRILRLVSEDFKIAEAIKKSPKGMSVVLERSGKSAKPEPTAKTATPVKPASAPISNPSK